MRVKKIFPSCISLVVIGILLLSISIPKAQASTSVSEETGTMHAWGYNVYGQLGDGTHTTQTSPITLTFPVSIFSIGGGYWHTLALQYGGTVWAWGRNSNGQIGDGSTIERNTPVQVASLEDVTAISAGAYHNLALTSDGSVWAWGWNGGGQLGDGTKTDRLTPVQVANLSDVVAISAGYEHSLALKSDGTVWAWGYNYEGQLGSGNNADSTLPVEVIGLTNIKSISAGWFHSMALKTDGSLWAWGMNSYGELGIGSADNDPHSLPTQVSLLQEVSQICGGSYHSMAITTDGKLWVWGNNSQGQLGDGSTTSQPTPQQVPGLSNILNMTGGWGHSLAVTSNGDIFAWGINDRNQLGLGMSEASSFTAILPNEENGISSNTISEPIIVDESTPALANGNEWQWGQSINSTSVLFEPTNQFKTNLEVQSLSSVFFQPNPTLISGISFVSIVAAGYYHSLAIVPNPRPAWDVNGDHIVNVGDIILVGSHWNQSGPPGWIPEDINSDGYIDVGDLVIIGSHWNESW